VTRSGPANAVASHRSLFQSFADPAHLAIVEVLLRVSRMVGEVFEEAASISRTFHRSCPRECDLVIFTQRGHYEGAQLCDVGVAALIGVGQLLIEIERGRQTSHYDA
jgi:hypothetical protein